ncbi:MAG TPA: dihydropteroate synthase, partial [Modicisalibacter sp.]|nr:dihydropteroate synthase [Modicisalibacter sp.]
MRAPLSGTVLQCGRHRLDLSYPRVMGILNITPDSFSDGGQHTSVDDALRHAEVMLAEGAAIIDVGGESTRPGAISVSAQQELDRVVPVVERLVRELDALVSVDTSSPEVMREVAAQGAGLINDVRSLRRPGALEAAASSGLPICVMHMLGEPGDMQHAPDYDVPVERAVTAFLEQCIVSCEA